MESEPQQSSRTYSVESDCTNCGYSGFVEVTKGLLIKDALVVLPCPTCGCKTLTNKKNKDDIISPYSPVLKPLRQKRDPFGNPFAPQFYTSPNTNPKRINDNKFYTSQRTSNDDNSNRTSNAKFGIGNTQLARSLYSLYYKTQI